MKNHYHIKMNEDFREEIVLDNWSYENYLTQWNRQVVLRDISTITKNPEIPAEEKIKRIEGLMKRIN